MDNFFEELEKPKTKDEILLEKKAKFYKPVDDALLKQSGFELNKVYNADCLEIMRSMPDKCVDLVLTDPPYGLGISGQKENIKNKKSDRKFHKDLKWDNQAPSKDVFNEIFRISKNQVIWGGNYFIDKLNKNTKGWIIWDKMQHGLTMSDCELCFTSFDIPTRIWKMNRVILQVEGETLHPTQKPVALFSWILKNYAKPNDIIFDPFAGSGTTAISCMQMDHPYILVEKEKDYYDIIMKRINKKKKDLVALF